MDVIRVVFFVLSFFRAFVMELKDTWSPTMIENPVHQTTISVMRSLSVTPEHHFGVGRGLDHG